MIENNYEQLRLDVLIKLIDQRGIECKYKKDEIIKYLLMDDAGKFVRETTYEKSGDGYLIRVDLKNRDHIMQLSKLVEKGEANRVNRFEDNRIVYYSVQKLM